MTTIHEAWVDTCSTDDLSEWVRQKMIRHPNYKVGWREHDAPAVKTYSLAGRSTDTVVGERCVDLMRACVAHAVVNGYDSKYIEAAFTDMEALLFS